MPLPQNYNPKDFESRIYQKWMQNQVGSVEKQQSTQGLNEDVKTHSILMPPPNLTGNLHAGHAFQHYIMDTLSRINRQNSKLNLWFPGVDHAGIQLEGVVDKLIKKGEFDEEIKKFISGEKILKQVQDDSSKNQFNSENLQTTNEVAQQILDLLESKNRDDLPKLIKQNYPEIWTELAWSKVNLWRDNQQNQAKVLGDTPDYARSLFTLDDKANKMVNYAFNKYWEDGLIYKGAYLVNWSVGLQTAVSDMAGEIEYTTRKDPFVTFTYKIKDIEPKMSLKLNQIEGSSIEEVNKKWIDNFKNQDLPDPEAYTDILKLIKEIKVSTVRPETVFGDVALLLNRNILKKDLLANSIEEVRIDKFIELIGEGNIIIRYNIKDLNINNVKLIIGDDNEVDPNFGTGALKITPASDQHDYDIFNKYIGGNFPHSIGRDGKLTEVCGEFAGLTVEQGRLAVIKRLAETGYIPVKKEFENETKEILFEIKNNLSSQSFNPTDYSYEEGVKRLQQIMSEAGQKLQIDWDYEHNVTICERSKTVIEPLISEEFFIDYTKSIQQNDSPLRGAPVGIKLQGKALDPKQVSDPDVERRGISTNNQTTTLQKLGLEGVNEVEYFSSDYKSRAVNFVENIKNWCISRDLTWGHRFPVWYNLDVNPEKKFYSAKELEKSQSLSLKIQSNKPAEPGNWVQEEKILDTWFSSCLWPLSTLGFVENKDVKVVIIHGSPETKRDYKISQRHWFPTLKTDLEKLGVQVFNPEMPNSEKPTYEEWKKTLEDLPIKIDDQTILIGHSAGGAFLVRYLNEKQLNVKQLVLVSASSTVQDSTSRLHQLSNFEIDSSIQKLKVPTVVITSKDEPEYRHKNAENYAKVFDTQVTYFQNYGHFTQQDMGKNDFPELLDLLDINSDFTKFYPTSEMVTGGDIFYIWVVRMIILGKYFTNQIPFKKVIINPTVLDEKGRKMSKSLGNGLDPVEAINKYSSDSLRLGMLSGMIPGRNMKMGGKIAENLMEKYRNFGNKLWNVGRFLENQED